MGNNQKNIKEALDQNAIRITEKMGDGESRNSTQRPIGGNIMNNPLNPQNLANQIDFSIRRNI